MALDIKGLFNPTSVSIPTSHLAEIMDGGEEPTDSFTVTKNLSHCAISNEQIGKTSYYAEIAPTGGWSDLQVTIKVGGVDMSEYYSSGVINIPNVTGNIVITATAAAAPLTSITATYTQSGTVYDTDSLDSLKADLVVTANYDNGTSETVTTYTLSGALTVGTSAITVSYGGKTTTFNVTVTDSLPSTYTRVDYLTSAVHGTPTTSHLTTTPYIKTDFPPADTDMIDYEINLVYQPLFNDAEYVPFGGRDTRSGSSTTKGIVLYGSNTQSQFQFGFSDSIVPLRQISFIASLTEKTVFKYTNKGVYFNNQLLLSIADTSAPVSGTYKIVLFGRNNAGRYSATTSGGDLSPMIGKIYEFNIKDANGDYVLNYIPCYRNADNVYGMYDKVSGNFYTSAISTAFSGGND